MDKVTFDKKEVFSLVLTSVIISFILSFKKWGVEQFDVGEGIANLILMSIIVLFSLYVKLCVQKYAGYKAGIHAVFGHWRLGLIIGLTLAFLSNGEIPFIALGFLSFSIIQHIRIGYKYNFNLSTMALVSFVGIITTLVLAGAFKFLHNATGIEFFLTAMYTNLLFAFFALLPLPLFETHKKVHDSEGLIMLYRSPIGYIGAVVLVLLSILGLLKLTLFVGIGLAVLCSALLMMLYHIMYEQK